MTKTGVMMTRFHCSPAPPHDVTHSTFTLNRTGDIVKFSHILYWTLGPELIPVYCRQSACR